MDYCKCVETIHSQPKPILAWLRNSPAPVIPTWRRKTVEGNTSGGSNPSFSAVLWCNGSTTVFGAVCSSSNLDRTTLFLCVNFYSIIFDLILFVYSPRPRWNVDRFPNRFLRTF